MRCEHALRNAWQTRSALIRSDIDNRPADDAPARQIQDRRQIQPALAGSDEGDVAYPGLIGPPAVKNADPTDSAPPAGDVSNPSSPGTGACRLGVAPGVAGCDARVRRPPAGPGQATVARYEVSHSCRIGAMNGGNLGAQRGIGLGSPTSDRPRHWQ